VRRKAKLHEGIAESERKKEKRKKGKRKIVKKTVKRKLYALYMRFICGVSFSYIMWKCHRERILGPNSQMRKMQKMKTRDTRKGDLKKLVR
jgi:hypothetical protein